MRFVGIKYAHHAKGVIAAASPVDLRTRRQLLMISLCRTHGPHTPCMPRSAALRWRRESGGRVSVYRVNKVMFDLQVRPGLWDEFKSDFAAVAARYGLTDEEAHALRDVNATTLSRLGAQPYLLRFYTVQQGMGNDEFIRQLELV